MNENQLTIVKEYEFDKPDIHESDCLLDDYFKDCRNKYFHTFEYRLVYDINFTNISNNEEVNFTITHRAIKVKTKFYGLNEKIKKAQKNDIIFYQINNFKIKIYSILSNINIHYYVNLQIPNLHRQFFKKTSQNRDYVEAFCTDLSILFHFTCREWYSRINPQC